MPGFRRAACVALTCALGAGCRHSGAGKGDLQSAPAPTTGAETSKGSVAFIWKSKSDPSQGKIEATLADGRRFTGEYLQMTHTATETAITPYWNAWTAPAWGPPGFGYGGPATATAFVTEYSGQVLAHLREAHGQKMRCRFVLKHPDRGVTDGASGDCQLSTGESVFGATLREGKAP